jgi:hypothetical protein
MAYVPIAAVLVRRAVDQVGAERPTRRPGLLHRLAVAFGRAKTQP